MATLRLCKAESLWLHKTQSNFCNKLYKKVKSPIAVLG